MGLCLYGGNLPRVVGEVYGSGDCDVGGNSGGGFQIRVRANRSGEPDLLLRRHGIDNCVRLQIFSVGGREGGREEERDLSLTLLFPLFEMAGRKAVCRVF